MMPRRTPRAGLLRSDERVEHDLAYLLGAAAGLGEPGGHGNASWRESTSRITNLPFEAVQHAQVNQPKLD
jgi:hypothetical protein